MTRIDNINGAEPTEYFCMSCGQLRLSLTHDKSKCGNCGSQDIVTGAVNSIDKEAMLRMFNNEDTP